MTDEQDGKQTEEQAKQDKQEERKEEPTQERLDEARSEAVRYRRDLRAAQSAHDETRKELERLRAENESGQEKAVREAVEAARQEERELWRGKLLEAQVTARAAGKLADPGDAVRLLAMQELLADEDEDSRQKRMDTMLDELLEAKPYLAANGQTGKQTRELVSQGARSTAPKTSESSPDDWIRKRGRSRR